MYIGDVVYPIKLRIDSLEARVESLGYLVFMHLVSALLDEFVELDLLDLLFHILNQILHIRCNIIIFYAIRLIPLTMPLDDFLWAQIFSHAVHRSRLRRVRVNTLTGIGFMLGEDRAGLLAEPFQTSLDLMAVRALG